jgi:hypothetical protein
MTRAIALFHFRDLLHIPALPFQGRKQFVQAAMIDLLTRGFELQALCAAAPKH